MSARSRPVVRDLRTLNTKRIFEDPPDAFRNLRDSLFVYGLKDFSAHNPKAGTVRHQLRLEIERAISRFEPRLRNVVVQLETDGEKERSLRFRISAVLIVEPLAEPVTFDTVLDVNKAQFKVADPDHYSFANDRGNNQIPMANWSLVICSGELRVRS
jgi:type VI secretion system protein ImpF